jgi:hypothetical protein
MSLSAPFLRKQPHHITCETNPSSLSVAQPAASVPISGPAEGSDDKAHTSTASLGIGRTMQKRISLTQRHHQGNG